MEVREARAAYATLPMEPACVTPPGYKQTEAGLIPEDWEVRALYSLVRSHNSGIYKSQALYGHGCNIVGVSDIYGIEKIDGQHFAHVPLSSQERAKHTLRCNDLLYGESSLVREGIARTVYVTEQGADTAFAWHTRRYSIDQRLLLSSYLYYYLQSRPARAHMISRSIQTAITGINTVAYFACPTIVPSYAEQEAIAEALSDADALIESLQQLIAKKCQIKQGAMQALLSGKQRLPGFSNEWATRRLGDLAALSKASINPQLMPEIIYTHFSLPAFDEGALPAVEPGVAIESNKFVVPKDAVLLSKLNPRIPRVWAPDVILVNSICSTEFLVLVPRPEVSREFFGVICRSPMVSAQMELHAVGTTGSHQRIHPTQALHIEVVIPVDKNEQAAISTILTDMDTELAELETRLAKTRELKQGMMQALLTGRIRLV